MKSTDCTNNPRTERAGSGGEVGIIKHHVSITISRGDGVLFCLRSSKSGYDSYEQRRGRAIWCFTQ